MFDIKARIICAVIGYAFGLIQSAFIYGKLHGVDIRTVGSGNAGSTNALRAFGTKAGFTVLFFDALKTIAAILLLRFTMGRCYPEDIALITLYTAIGVILGHNFPFYLNFKGGKGMAATLGFVLSFLVIQPWYFITMFPLFVVIFLLTHYVSLGSMLAYVMFFIETIIFGNIGMLGDNLSLVTKIELDCIAFFLMSLAIFQHRANVVRLIKGTESKTYLSKKNREAYKAAMAEKENANESKEAADKEA